MSDGLDRSAWWSAQGLLQGVVMALLTRYVWKKGQQIGYARGYHDGQVANAEERLGSYPTRPPSDGTRTADWSDT